MSSSPGTHSLAFRVMRLCRPSFHVDPPLRLDPTDLIAGEDIFDDPIAASHLPRLIDCHVANPSDSSDLSYRSRFLLHDPSDPMGLSGLLVLPQSFGAIYLGETFCSYISINNSSNFEVKEVTIKVSVFTFHSSTKLFNNFTMNGSSQAEMQRRDRESCFWTPRNRPSNPYAREGATISSWNTMLVCTALYNDGDGERKYLPQFFKFVVANPLSVRTKETTFLEACIENHTKSNLFMDQVEFEPTQHWSATILKANEHDSDSNSKTREPSKQPVLIRSGGGIHNYLYQLKLSSHGSAQMKVEGSNILGKLQITWRTNLGEPGRLQTQQILGTPVTRSDIELQVVEVPSIINLERTFSLHLKLTNQTERELGPFEVSLLQNGFREEKVIMINGLKTMVLPAVAAFGYTDFHLNLIATKLGVQRITGITVFDTREKRSYDPFPDLEIFVDLD
ncbi:hypothetical protein SLA2020_274240 [Shorea laevis]